MRSLIVLALCLSVMQVAMASSMATNKTLSALLQGKLVKGVLVKGAKHAMGAGAGLAAGALSGLPVTTFEPYTVANNLTRGYRVEGDSHCFPKYRAAIVEKPTFQCGSQYSLNHTKLGAACVKRTLTTVNNCFKSLKCPSNGNYSQADHICLPEEVRNAMVGILTVFKVKATLPFVLIPSLKKALTKAVLTPIILPKSLLLSMAFNHTELLGEAYSSKFNSSAAVMAPFAAYSDDANITVTHPGDLAKLAFEDLSQAGEGVMRALVNGSINPLEVVTKGILNCNVTDIKRAVPEIEAWVASKLGGVNVSDIGEAINETFPRCVSKCCRPENHKDTSLVLPTPTCSNGTQLNSMLGLCVGGEMGYAPCQSGFERCALPNGAPVCLAESKVLGMDSCKVAAALMHNLPKVQCPAPDAANATDASGAATGPTDASSWSFGRKQINIGFNKTGEPSEWLQKDISLEVNNTDPYAY